MRSGNLDIKKALSHSRLYAGCARQTLGYGTLHRVQFDKKVKAHQKEESLTSQSEIWKARANNAADAAADKGREKHDEIPKAIFAEAKQAAWKVTCLLHLFGALLQLWPKASPPKLAKARSPGQMRRHKEEALQHEWVFWFGRWGCRRCLTIAKTDKSKSERARERCPGFSPILAGIVEEPRGHQLIALHMRGALCNLFGLRRLRYHEARETSH